MAGGTPTALGAALVHTVAMRAASGAVALAVHAWPGLRVLSQGRFNLETVWALSLILVGGLGFAGA